MILLMQQRSSKEGFEAIRNLAIKYYRKSGNMAPSLVCDSALDNAQDTAREQGFEIGSTAYWQCAYGSLQCLLCDEANERTVRWFKRNGFEF
jgi:hypothetical protein